MGPVDDVIVAVGMLSPLSQLVRWIGNAGGTMRSTLAPSQRQLETWLQYVRVASQALAYTASSSTRVSRPFCTSVLPSTITVWMSRAVRSEERRVGKECRS